MKNLKLKANQGTGEVSLIYHPEYYDYNAGSGVWQMNAYNTVLLSLNQNEYNIVMPEKATVGDANFAHTPEYVNKVFSKPDTRNNPGWSGNWDEKSQAAVLRSTGGMIKANEEALKNGHAIQLYDAFHHAYPDHGEGFCVLNDVAIAALKYANAGYKVMIIDTDVHQGQGTAVCTANNKNIYTISLHEEDNYPHKKEKSSIDWGFGNNITDDQYLIILKECINVGINDFGDPDLVMYIAGTDLYENDKLSHTNITMDGIKERDKYVYSFFGVLGIPVSTSIPQGYAKDINDSIMMIHNTIQEAKNAKEKYYK